MKYHAEKLAEGESTKHHQNELDRLNSEDTYLVGNKFMFDTDIYCFKCGNGVCSKTNKKHVAMKFGLKDLNTFEVILYNGGRLECEVKDEPIRTEIDIPSGNVIFANHFGKEVLDAPEDEKYGNKYSINALYGRINTAKHLARNGYGYGQMGNSSIEVYVSKDKKSIKIVGPGIDYINEEIEYLTEEKLFDEITPQMTKTYETYKELVIDHKLVGEISMSIWRWMCCDKTNFNGDDISDENFETTVEPGKWEIIHNYDYDRDSAFASELRLISKNDL